MNWPVYTVIFILAVIALIIVVDIVWAFNGADGDTISEVIRESAKRWTGLMILWCVGFGVLLGHWFW